MSSNKPVNYNKMAESAFQKMEKANADLFCLTYGSLVAQLLQDCEDVAAVNSQLNKIGYSIGGRMADEFLAKSSLDSCGDFRETAEVIAKVGFRMFLGITADVSDWSSNGNACTITVPEPNPLTDFVEVPANLHGLSYSNVICGVIKGALEEVGMGVSCRFIKDTLMGDTTTEIRLELKELLKEEFVDES